MSVRVRLVSPHAALKYSLHEQRELATFCLLPKVGDLLGMDRITPWRVDEVVLPPQPEADGAVALILHDKGERG